jgi:hypothetical protein
MMDENDLPPEESGANFEPSREKHANDPAQPLAVFQALQKRFAPLAARLSHEIEPIFIFDPSHK